MASMTKTERANYYCKILCNSPNIETATEIARSINSLVYTESKKPVSINYKLGLVSLMEENWSKFYPILEHSENQSILALISQIKSTINK